MSDGLKLDWRDKHDCSFATTPVCTFEVFQVYQEQAWVIEGKAFAQDADGRKIRYTNRNMAKKACEDWLRGQAEKLCNLFAAEEGQAL